MFCELAMGVAALLQQDELTRRLEEGRSASPKEVRIEVQGGVWFVSLEGSGRLNRWFGTEREERLSPRLSFPREGGVGGTEPFPELEVRVLWEHDADKYKGFQIRLGHGLWSEWGTVDRAFSVDGTTIGAGSSFHSRYEIFTGAVEFVGGICPADLPFEVRGWGGCRFHTERFQMETAPGTLKDGAGGLNFGFGVHLEYRFLPFMFASGELSASIGFGVPLTEAEAAVGFVWNRFRLEAGYRHLWASWDPDPDFRLSMGGVFVGGSIGF